MNKQHNIFVGALVIYKDQISVIYAIDPETDSVIVEISDGTLIVINKELAERNHVPFIQVQFSKVGFTPVSAFFRQEELWYRVEPNEHRIKAIKAANAKSLVLAPRATFMLRELSRLNILIEQAKPLLK